MKNNQNIINKFFNYSEKLQKETAEKIIFASQVYGSRAFKKEIKSAPCLDKDFIDYVKTIQHIEGAAVLALKNWSKAWDSANNFKSIKIL